MGDEPIEAIPTGSEDDGSLRRRSNRSGNRAGTTVSTDHGSGDWHVQSEKRHRPPRSLSRQRDGRCEQVETKVNAGRSIDGGCVHLRTPEGAAVSAEAPTGVLAFSGHSRGSDRCATTLVADPPADRADPRPGACRPDGSIHSHIRSPIVGILSIGRASQKPSGLPAPGGCVDADASGAARP